MRPSKSGLSRCSPWVQPWTLLAKPQAWGPDACRDPALFLVTSVCKAEMTMLFSPGPCESTAQAAPNTAKHRGLNVLVTTCCAARV